MWNIILGIILSGAADISNPPSPTIQNKPIVVITSADIKPILVTKQGQ